MFVCRINNECVKNREARIGIDLVKDEVENSLEREVENIKTYQQRMQKMLARVNQQIETNHSMQVTRTPQRSWLKVPTNSASAFTFKTDGSFAALFLTATSDV